MWRNKAARIGLLLVMCLAMAFGTATTAFAYVDESAAEEEPVVVIKEDIPQEEYTETEEVPAEDSPEPTEDSEIDRSGLTPDGNMDLVDDLSGEDAENLQFLTVSTKSGHTFYIIIERNKNSENVHFLNQVDEADLMALMSDEEKEQFVKENAPEETEPVITPTVIPEETETPEPAVTEEPQKNTGANPLAMLGVFGVIGAAVIGAYYFLKVKPGREKSQIGDDLEFYDDEEYENEDLTPDDEGYWLDEDDFPDIED